MRTHAHTHTHTVRMGNLTSNALTLSTGAPQGCILSPLQYALFTYDCEATRSSNAILKFADDTTILGLISNNDETAYREIGDLATSLSTSARLRR